MSNDTQFTEDNKNLLRGLGLLNVQLKMTSEAPISQTITWGQAKLDLLFDVERSYKECTYSIIGDNGNSKVKVFVADECGTPPDIINTSGHQQGGGALHFGYIFHDEQKDVKAIFFVIHPNSWGPFQKRFRTNTMLSLLDMSINAVADKVGGKLGAVVGASVGSLIPIPVVGTAAGMVVGYFIGETTVAIADAMAGDYLRYIG